jgi:hypothetical protein
MTVLYQGLHVTEGDAPLGDAVTVSSALCADGSVGSAPVTAFSDRLQAAALTAATSAAAATVSVQHADFTSNVLSPKLARELVSASGNISTAGAATAMLLLACLGGGVLSLLTVLLLCTTAE